MAISYTDALARAILDSGFGTAFDSGTLEIRSGAAPGPSAAATGTLIWSFSISSDSFAAASGRCATAGMGSARKSIFPPRVSGSEGRTPIATGTM